MNQPVPKLKSDGRSTTIYALHDPSETSQRVYVGMSVRPGKRLQEHLRDAMKRKTVACNWMRSLLRQGVTPKMEELEVVPPGGDYQEAEQFWISSLRYMGVALVNQTIGGHGSRGYVPTPEVREKLSKKNRGRKMPREGVERRAAMLRGRKRSPEHIEKIAAAHRGKKMSPESIARVLEGRKLQPVRKDNVSGFKGVKKQKLHWCARIAGKHLGHFGTAEGAAQAYDVAARKAWGTEAAFNFPFPGEKSARPGIEPQVWNLPPPPKERVPGLNQDNRSGFRGVSWSAAAGKWYASTKLAGKSVNLGFYDDPAVAHQAYCAARAQKGGQ